MISFEEGDADLSVLKPLFQKEWEEVGSMKDIIPLNVNIPLYESLIRAGKGVVYLAKDNDVVAGYSCWTLAAHPKYQDSGLWAFGAGIYLLPGYRGARTAWRLVSYSETKLKERGVRFILAGSRVNHSAASRLFEAMDYTPHEVAHIKAL